MSASPLTDVAHRLFENVETERGDLTDSVMRVPSERYRDQGQWQLELDAIFRSMPVVTALSVDIPDAGDYTSITLAERPVFTVRGSDGIARTFLNACRHRGAEVAPCGLGHTRRFTCPYHSWVYDTTGALVGVPQREQFGEVDVTGLIELPTAERAGLVFAILTPDAHLDIDEWLGDMGDALEMLELDQLYPYGVITELVSGNWKSTADGFLDGYHIGYLHRASIGDKAITNRNTYDMFGPHVRIGFANKPIIEMGSTPVEEWDLPGAMSLVHYVFPNISLSGQPGRPMMMSRLHPGPTVDRCTVQTYHYSRTPIDSDEKRQEMEARRELYTAVTRDEDFVTVLGVNRNLAALGDHPFLFGRNESGNQNLHTWVAKLTGTDC
jgi:phenylpropionate dioxygenase-like ring-hydroxylating dioxygenase large terminal subunit